MEKAKEPIKKAAENLTKKVEPKFKKICHLLFEHCRAPYVSEQAEIVEEELERELGDKFEIHMKPSLYIDGLFDITAYKNYEDMNAGNFEKGQVFWFRKKNLNWTFPKGENLKKLIS